ncbi:MAG: hypothetical protein US31_C0009G0027 [Berkelbacteria bacterium GW2011_GWA1_36_9]|uniref:Prepilin-type N-terminal cleavage/methylation domain-containing protein n=1 Tax=Berkelbacteria bacterium GW2011_GWA1_36_9 TaxID=1618331 RepID=A0A0G0FGH3_9BACT|nr:MAG: hypothetical protein US31_C0009G0027 [Berkelbacteria bacterium GW2011_GWA1_36_9]
MLKNKNLKLKVPKRGFTLIEMLVAVFVFMILFLIAASFVNLASGSAKSTRTKLLTSHLRNTFDVISQKMNNANGHASMGSDPDIYGFGIQDVSTGPPGKSIETEVLGIASYDKDTSTTSCTFFSRVFIGAIVGGGGQSYLYMANSDCSEPWPNLFLVGKPLFDPNNISGNFNPTMTPSVWKPSDQIAPYLTIQITAQDTDPKYATDNIITLKTSYTMDYQTIKRLQNL